jgi:hypothetical protein
MVRLHCNVADATCVQFLYCYGIRDSRDPTLPKKLEFKGGIVDPVAERLASNNARSYKVNVLAVLERLIRCYSNRKIYWN